MYRMVLKRILDVTVSLCLILLLSWLFLFIAILIKVTSRGPVFFHQKRIGINKTYFSILKFRSMRINAPKDTPTHLLTDPDAFITPIGKVLRKTSLDELPQLFNILIGDMSFVGPRPALWNQTDLIMERDRYGANNIRPGLTGWAQINGRDEIEIALKAKYDGEYVLRESLFFDCKIFLLTFINVIFHKGVMEGGTGKTEKNDK